MDIDNDEPATQVTSTLTSTHPNVLRLENETRQQKQALVTMEKQIQNMQQSIQELVQYKTQEDSNKVKVNGWQQNLTAQLKLGGGVAHDTKQSQVALQRDMLSVR